METLPTEICQDILELACTDDISIARSLPLVSRWMRDVSARPRLHSISISSPKQILAFALFLSRLRSTEARVCSLFIGTASSFRPSPDDQETLKSLATTSRANGEAQAMMWERLESDATKELIEQTILHILKRVSGTLRKLHTHLVGLTRSSLLPAVFLPHLEELALYGPFDSSSSAIPSIQMPSLRVLRLEHFHFHPLSRLLPLLPNLTHLRIPMCSITPHELLAALGWEAKSSAYRFPVQLQQVVVEVECPDQSSHSFEAKRQATRLVRVIENMSQRDKRLGLVLVHRSWKDLGQAKGDWCCGNDEAWFDRNCRTCQLDAAFASY